MNLDERVRKLEQKPENRDMEAAFNKIYEALIEADLKTTGCFDEKEFIAAHGTREAFVEAKLAQWQHQHKKGE